MFNLNVYIIILNWNGLKDTLECLESVNKINYSNFNVVVVDNGSTDSSVEVIKQRFPEITLIENKENLGFAEGSNIGIRYALSQKADYFWLLNNDTVVEKNCLLELVNKLESESNAALASPIIKYYSNPERIQFCGSYFDFKKFSIKEFKNIEDILLNINKPLCLWGTALLIKKSAFDQIGFLNTSYFAYAEDSEYSLRSLKMSFCNIVVSDAVIYHKNEYVNSKKELVVKKDYWYFYNSRNNFFLWNDNAASIKKLKFYKNYFHNYLLLISFLKKNKQLSNANAVLDAIYNALINNRKIYGKHKSMPNILKKILICHPYFLSKFI